MSETKLVDNAREVPAPAKLTFLQAVQVLSMERCMSSLAKEAADLRAFEQEPAARELLLAVERCRKFRAHVIEEANNKVILPKLILPEAH